MASIALHIRLPTGAGGHRLAMAAGAALLLLTGLGAGTWVGPALRAGGRLPARATATGWVEATEVKLAFEAGGRLLELLAAEGTEVQAGAALARLDPTLAEAQAAQTEANLRMARLQLDKFDQEYASGLAALETQVELARAQLEAARIQSQREPVLAAVQLEAARAGLTRARQTPAGLAGALGIGPAAEQIEVAVRAAEAQYQKSLELTAAQLRQAEGQYDLAQQKLASLRGSHTTNRGLLDQQIALAEAAREATGAQLAKLTLKAPLGGRLVLLPARAGEVVAPGQPIAILQPTGTTAVKVYVAETHLPRIRVGDPVVVTGAALAGRVYGGQVTWIGTSPEYIPRNSGTPRDERGNLYAVRVQLAPGAEEWRPGMGATVEFFALPERRAPGVLPGPQGRPAAE